MEQNQAMLVMLLLFTLQMECIISIYNIKGERIGIGVETMILEENS